MAFCCTCFLITHGLKIAKTTGDLCFSGGGADSESVIACLSFLLMLFSFSFFLDGFDGIFDTGLGAC